LALVSVPQGAYKQAGFCRSRQICDNAGLPRPSEERAKNMSTTHTVINIIGEIALLLWGIHMVRSGVTRVFGTTCALGRG
jgi:hypothetical protein